MGPAILGFPAPAGQHLLKGKLGGVGAVDHPGDREGGFAQPRRGRPPLGGLCDGGDRWPQPRARQIGEGARQGQKGVAAVHAAGLRKPRELAQQIEQFVAVKEVIGIDFNDRAVFVGFTETSSTSRSRRRQSWRS